MRLGARRSYALFVAQVELVLGGVNIETTVLDDERRRLRKPNLVFHDCDWTAVAGCPRRKRLLT